MAQRLNPVLFLLPALTIYIVFAIYPTISVVEYSFTDWGRYQSEPQIYRPCQL